eukprot:SAG22_NODE_18189_length_291_cov_1.067708_1_plen_34_part_10
MIVSWATGNLFLILQRISLVGSWFFNLKLMDLKH